MSSILGTGIIMGLLATALMDIWGLLLHRIAGTPRPSWGLPGRWVAHMPRGRLYHDDIGAAEPVVGEAVIGWVFHYVVGVIYGVALAAIMGGAWLTAPTFLPAWVFSILMLGFGWFLMQPGMGAGMAASKTPRPWRARVLGLAAHTVFGVGLWIGALL